MGPKLDEFHPVEAAKSSTTLITFPNIALGPLGHLLLQLLLGVVTPDFLLRYIT